MHVFQLSLLVCLSQLDGGSDVVMSRQCRWEALGFYAVEAVCEVTGAGSDGSPWYSGTMYIRGAEKVERHRCQRIFVQE